MCRDRFVLSSNLAFSSPKGFCMINKVVFHKYMVVLHPHCYLVNKNATIAKISERERANTQQTHGFMSHQIKERECPICKTAIKNGAVFTIKKFNVNSYGLSDASLHITKNCALFPHTHHQNRKT